MSGRRQFRFVVTTRPRDSPVRVRCDRRGDDGSSGTSELSCNVSNTLQVLVTLLRREAQLCTLNQPSQPSLLLWFTTCPGRKHSPGVNSFLTWSPNIRDTLLPACCWKTTSSALARASLPELTRPLIMMQKPCLLRGGYDSRKTATTCRDDDRRISTQLVMR